MLEKEIWEPTQKTSHFQQHFKLIFKSVGYLMKYSLSLHYKLWGDKLYGLRFDDFTMLTQT